MLVVAVVVLYIGDTVSVRVRMKHPTPTSPFEAFTRTRMLAIPEKGGRAEIVVDPENPTEKITCVHAIFPHSGSSPCWQVKKPGDKIVPMTIVAPVPIFGR